MDYRDIKVTYKIPLVSEEGIDSDELNPLKRALHNLLERGKPLKNFTMTFINDQTSENKNTLRWFGVFVHSVGDRIIFFPGFSERQKYVKGFVGKSKVWDKKFLFDHFSVDKNLKKWHLTTIDPVKHLGSRNLLKLDEDRYLLLGLSVNYLDQFRVVKQVTEFSYAVPKPDAERRKDIILDAKGEKDYSILNFYPKGYYNPEIYQAKFQSFGKILW